MKAKVKDTGEIVDVRFAIHPNPDVADTYWWCKDKEESYHKSELDFMECDIDWEQRRYELAKEAMNSILTAPVVEGVNPNPSAEDVAIYSVTLADALIRKLKE
jgi:hypothetical protein